MVVAVAAVALAVVAASTTDNRSFMSRSKHVLLHRPTLARSPHEPSRVLRFHLQCLASVFNYLAFKLGNSALCLNAPTSCAFRRDVWVMFSAICLSIYVQHPAFEHP
jgi:hypothetical protein